MKKHVLLARLLMILMFTGYLSSLSSVSLAQDCIFSSSFGNQTITGPTPVTIVGIWAGEFGPFQGILANEDYQFSSTNPSDHLTLTDEFNNPLGLNGTTPLVWNSGSYTGTVRVHVASDASCSTMSSNRDLSGQCTSCPPPPPGACIHPNGWSTQAFYGATPVTNQSVWQGEYCTFTGVQNGFDYQFTSSGGGDWLTITDESNIVITFGAAPLDWTANFDGNIRIHWALDASCATFSGSRDITGQCLNCPVPPLTPCVNFGGFWDQVTLYGATPVSVSTWYGEYSIVNGVVDNQDYEFTPSGAPYITITDDAFNVLFFDFAPFTWNSGSFSGTIYIHGSDNPDCNSGSGSLTIQCPNCPLPPPSPCVFFGGGWTIGTLYASDPLFINAWSGEYSVVNGVQANEDYDFTVSGSSFITITDDAFNVLFFDYAPFTWNSGSYSGTIYIHPSDNPGCTGSNSSITIQCQNCPVPPPGPCITFGSGWTETGNLYDNVPLTLCTSWSNEYTTFNGVQAGYDYSISASGPAGPAYVTITDASFNVLFFDYAPYTWNSDTYSGTILIHVTDNPACSYQDSHCATVQCLDCPQSPLSPCVNFGGWWDQATLYGDSPVTVSVWFGEYSIVNGVVENQDYEFTPSGSSYITITDDAFNVLFFDFAPFTWNSGSYSGTIYVHGADDPSCSSGSGSVTIQCPNCPLPPPAPCIYLNGWEFGNLVDNDPTSVWAWGSEYITFNGVLPNSDYDFTSNGPTFLTITDASFNVLFFGYAPFTWNSGAISGAVYVHPADNPSCIVTVSGQVTMQCTNCLCENSIVDLAAEYCETDAASTLSAFCTNTPNFASSYFVGPGMTGDQFDPQAAGPGTHTIEFGYMSDTYVVTENLANDMYTGALTSVFLTDDALTGSLPIGFSFDFYGTTYSDFIISSNGFLTFPGESNNGCCSGQLIPNVNTPNNLIAFAWNDLNPNNGGSIGYATTGTSPNQVLVVYFNNVPHFGGGGTPVDVQVKVYEGTNIIEVHSVSNSSDGSSHTMGLENAGGTAAVTASAGNANTGFNYSGQMVRFDPTPQFVAVATGTTTVNPAVAPTFDAVGPFCTGSFVPELPLTSLNGISGTWSPAINNSVTTEYTFTPDAGECASSATLTIVIQSCGGDAPENDEPCNAIDVTSAGQTSLNTFAFLSSMACNNEMGTNVNGTPDAVAPSCVGISTSGVWYTFTTPMCDVNGQTPFLIEVTTDSPNTDFNTFIAVYESSDNACTGSLIEVACNLDNTSSALCLSSSNPNVSSLALSNLEPNKQYWIYVDGAAGATGTFEISGRVLAFHAATPSGNGTSVTLTAENTGAGLYTYYYQQVGSSGYSVANSSSLSDTRVLASNVSYNTQVMYRCDATDNFNQSQWYRTQSETLFLESQCAVVNDMTCTFNGPNSYTLTWTQPLGDLFTNNGQLSGYRIKRNPVGTTSVFTFGNPAVVCTNGTCSVTLAGNNPNGFNWTIETRCSATTVQIGNTSTCGPQAPEVPNNPSAMVAVKASERTHSFKNVEAGIEFVDVQMYDAYADFGLNTPMIGDYEIYVNANNEVNWRRVEAPIQANFDFVIVPNPSNAMTTVYMNSIVEEGSFTVIDAMGRTIFAGSINNTDNVDVDATQLQSGVYMVVVTVGNQQLTRRLIVAN